ncbi:MAG: DNA topoisomerase IV subunit A [Candidatus Bathyarchaeota archaeon]|nr:DNA topoisomerase IV subunit A [Candidatus Bathyarchaeota archaeon]
MTNKNVEKTATEREGIVQKSLESLGTKFCREIDQGLFPWVEMKSRSTDNIFYSPEHRQYILGDRTVKRSSRIISHLRPFTQMVWAAYFVHELLNQRKTSTLRDVYYSAQAYDVFFNDQSESDNIITDLETAIEHSRESFHVFPEERSAVFGDLTIQYTVPGYENRRTNMSSHPDGMMIGPALTGSQFIETSADKVIVIEKGAMFTRFVEERVYEKFNSILVYTAGQAPRSTRYFIRRLNQEMGLPVYIFSDADPWGMHIAMVIISGSANAAHLRELTTPDAKWAGVWASDIVDYKLPSNQLNERDMKRLRELKSDPRYKRELWQKEISTFVKIKKKCELEAFSRYGLTHIVDKYLPERLSELGA